MTGPHAYPGKPFSWFVNGPALAAAVVLALAVRFYGITTPAIWYDEAFSILLASHEPWQIWSITAKDVHPPLYYFMLHYWMVLFGDEALAVRSLGVVADVGTVLLSIKLMSLVATRRATWMAALLLALLPISVRYSQEARMYTLLGFWLMGATVALVCWVKAPEKKRFAAIYVMLMTAAFYTHYFAALSVLAHWFYWWWGARFFRPVLPARAWILVNGVIVMLFLPWMPHFIEQLSMNGLKWIPPVTAHSVLSLVWQFTIMNAVEEQLRLLHAVPLVVVLACAAVMIWKDHGQYCFNGLLIGYFLIPAFILILVALVVPVFSTRYLVFAAVGVPLIIATTLDIVGRRIVLLLPALMVVLTSEILGVYAVYQQADTLNGTNFRSSLRLDGLAVQIKQAARSNDEIVVEFLLLYLPFSYYNRTGIQPRIYTDASFNIASGFSNRNGYALLNERPKGGYYADLKRLNSFGHRVWWITFRVNATPPLSDKYWERSLTLVDGDVVAYLFTRRTISASPLK
ncbi:glycosyltransferase family 39 protein [Pseudomonas frederiksbergensis]|uniref:Uncharacterized protein n=1 Tax=Pseudomonas frederiksbergensis TaxID=104087 RepID=A0A0B1Z4W5_9PSED|nr:glycosyltransferase family 39 protein [Pseudomonas frederiksbergensis]KHK64418.1 hypothetical protein JZ00_11675 [Pseudomonas frederiksbergensis]